MGIPPHIQWPLPTAVLARACRAAFVLVTSVLALAGPETAAADILPTPRWRVVPSGLVYGAVERDGVVYLAGTFTHVFQPPPADPVFVDRTTGTSLTGCANTSGHLVLVPDPTGGALVVLNNSLVETFWDGNGPLAVAPGTTSLRILPNCRYDRAFATPKVADERSSNGALSLLDTGTVVLGAMFGSFSAQLGVYDRITGRRLAAFLSWPVIDMKLLGMAGPDTVIVKTVENPPNITESLRLLTVSTMTLSGPMLPVPSQTQVWVREGRVFAGQLFLGSGSPPPLYSFDAATLQPSAGWTNPTGTGVPWVSAGYLFSVDITRNSPRAVALVRRDLTTGVADPAWQPIALESDTQIAAVDGARIMLASASGYRFINAVTGGTEGWSLNALGSGGAPIVLGQAVAFGRLKGVSGVPRWKVAAVDAASGALLPFDPFAAPVYAAQLPVAVASTSTHLYVSLESLSGTARGIVRVDLQSGLEDPTWRVRPMGGQASTLVANGSMLYVGGWFTGISGTLAGVPFGTVPRSAAAAIDLSASQVAPWNPTVVDATGGSVAAMAVAGDSMYLGGTFSSVGGQPRGGFARVDLTTGALLAPALPVTVQLRTMASDGVNAYTLVTTAPFQVTLTRIAPFGGVTPAPLGTSTTFPAHVVFARGRVYADRERDALTFQPTASPVTMELPYAAENGVMSQVLNGPVGTLGFYYYGFAVAAPPSAPASLTATTSGDTVRLSWTATAGDRVAAADLGAASSYVVRAGSGSGLFDLADFDTGTLATSLTTRAPNGTYFVRVHAHNAFGLSPASNEVRFTLGTAVCTAPPGAPGSLSATVTGVQVGFAWGAAAGAVSYVVEAGSTTGASNLVVLNVGTGLSFGASAAPGTYYVRVRGSNACGMGPASNEVPVTLGTSVALPAAPQNLTASVTSGTVTLAWAAPESGGVPAGYMLEAGSGIGLADIAVMPTAGTGFVVTNVPAGTYYVRVRAVNAAGSGPPTADVSVAVR